MKAELIEKWNLDGASISVEVRAAGMTATVRTHMSSVRIWTAARVSWPSYGAVALDTARVMAEAISRTTDIGTWLNIAEIKTYEINGTSVGRPFTLKWAAPDRKTVAAVLREQFGGCPDVLITSVKQLRQQNK